MVDQLSGVFTELYREFAADLRTHLGEHLKAYWHRSDAALQWSATAEAVFPGEEVLGLIHTRKTNTA
jgi:hypothetical protein